MRIGRAFGLEMHAAASPGADSKTLAMMVPAADSRTDQDLRDIQLEDGRTVPFATVVKYLGTMISSDWTDTIAVKTRMDKANGMFAMNKSWLCSKDAWAENGVFAPNLAPRGRNLWLRGATFGAGEVASPSRPAT